MSEAAEDVGRLSGQSLGEYRLGRVLGEGGFGVVYEGVHEPSGTVVAVKMLHAHLSDVREVTRRFRREAEAMIAIRHPNVAAVLDSGLTNEGTPYFVMEKLQGIELGKHLDAGPLRVGEAARIVCELLDALTAVHARGIVHRDLKPDNVFLATMPDGSLRVKLLDFGVAKIADPLGQVSMATRTGTTIGTAYYMSPEQAQAKKDVDARADLYAVGVILFRMLTGRHPFDAESYPMLVVKICVEPPPPLSAFRADVPGDLVRLVDSLLAKDAGMRPSSAAEVRARLAPMQTLWAEPQLLSGVDLRSAPKALSGGASFVNAPTMLSADEPPSDERPSRRLTRALIGVGIAASVGGLYVMMRPEPRPETSRAPRVALPRPMPAEERLAFAPVTLEGGFRFVNPLPRVLPSFLGVAVAGEALLMVGRDDAAFGIVDRAITRIPLGVEGPFHAVVGASDSTFVAVGARGRIVVVEAGHGAPLVSGVEADLRDVVALGAGEYVVVGDRGTFLTIRGRSVSRVDTGVDEDLVAVATAGSEVLAVGEGGVALRWDRSSLRREASGSSRTLRGVAMCADAGTYAVGDEGTVMRRSVDAGGEASWTPVANRSREMLHDVACDGARVVAAGAQGGVLVIGGLSSIRLDSGERRSLQAIAATPGRPPVAVGQGGFVVGVGPDRIVRMTGGHSRALFDVALVSGALIAVGAEGTALRERETRFEVMQVPIGSGLSALANLTPDAAVAVGDLGAILEVTYQGVRGMVSPTDANLRGVVTGGGELLAVGTGGTLVRGHEGAFQRILAPVEADLRAVVGTPDDALVVGDAGTVLRVRGGDVDRIDCGVDEALHAAVRVDADFLVAGDDGLVLRVGDAGCSLVRRGGPDLRAIGPDGNGALLMVGVDGAALKLALPLAPGAEAVAVKMDTAGHDLHAIRAFDRDVVLVGGGGVILRRPRFVP